MPHASPPRPLAATRFRQRGLSIVEMMVGVTIGLIVVAAACLLIASQLADNRRLLIETQVQQDLRAAADIMTRELRRAGADGAAQAAVWSAGSSTQNRYLDLTPAAGTTGSISFQYLRANNESGPYGYQIASGALRTRVGAAWQDLTDRNVLVVEDFAVAIESSPPVRLPCPKLCPAGDDACWPTIAVRSLAVTVRGHAKADPAVARTVTSRTRLRNDELRFHATQVAAGTPVPAACPA